MRRFEQEAIVNQIMVGLCERADASIYVATKQKNYKDMKTIALWYRDMADIRQNVADKLAIALLIPYDQEIVKDIVGKITEEVALK
ncbi:hypothetical protein OAF71_00005 [bacterium]|nr:hypothetical protein [bacterium]|tara:strand:+ start:327 stop:584 length:258 start_codon:yes stop_codon:yes gene_type:complete